MKDTEIKLRKAVYELFRVVRMNAHMKKAQAELLALLAGTDVALQMYEGVPESEKLADAKEYFENLIAKVKESYGSKAISGVYSQFKTMLDDPEFCREIGLKDAVDAGKKSELFKKVFDLMASRAETWKTDDDYFSFFIETLKEVIMPTGEINEEQEEICPYCEGSPRKISKGEFFGPHSGENDGYVWGCECGAYAVMNEDGKVVGKLGDAILHQKRNLVKGAMCELCSLAGITNFESYRWFSLITGMKISSITDAEYLTVDQCNIALRIFIYEKQKLKEKAFPYPKDRNELLLFFADGGRLMVCNAFGFQYGRLIIPTEIGPGGIRIYGKEGCQSMSFSDEMKYEFKDDCLFIHHPSGRKEKYRMFPTEVRTQLFDLKESEIMAGIAAE